MKVEVNTENESKSLPFPKLMYSEDDGLIVLFIEFRKGILLSDPKSLYKNKGNHYSECWAMNCFTDFKGSITITQ